MENLINTNKKTSVKKKWAYAIAILFMICSLLLTLFASMPLDEEPDPNYLRMNPQAAWLFHLSASLSIFFTVTGLFIMFIGKLSSRVMPILLVLCLLVSGYRIISLEQYSDRCQHVESSVCEIGKPKFLPLW